MPKNRDITKVNLQLEPYQIILRPIVTEKGFYYAERHNVYSFEVNKLANKTQIKHAVEFLFDVKVTDVKTANRKGKKRRARRKIGQQRSWKKAMVKLDPESKISYF